MVQLSTTLRNTDHMSAFINRTFIYVFIFIDLQIFSILTNFSLAIAILFFISLVQSPFAVFIDARNLSSSTCSIVSPSATIFTLLSFLLTTTIFVLLLFKSVVSSAYRRLLMFRPPTTTPFFARYLLQTC